MPWRIYGMMPKYLYKIGFFIRPGNAGVFLLRSEKEVRR